MNKQTDETLATALERLTAFLDKSEPPSALAEAMNRNAALMTEPGFIKRQQQEMQRGEAERRRRADAELAAFGHQSGVAGNTPGQSALDRAMRALHQPAAQQAAPVERSAAPAPRGPINSLVGSRPDLMTRALRKGIMLERVKSFSGHRCQTPRCTNSAAWRVGGQYLCNACAEKRAGK